MAVEGSPSPCAGNLNRTTDIETVAGEPGRGAATRSDLRHQRSAPDKVRDVSLAVRGLLTLAVIA
jgi:hypothetical protein